MNALAETKPDADSLLAASAQQPGAYTDCFEARVPNHSEPGPLKPPERLFARFVYVFFDTRLFRTERALLRIAGKAPKSRTDPLALALGHTTRFAAWQVEARRPTELLLTVPNTPIRTWLALSDEGDDVLLRFGSAILPREGEARPHWAIRATYGPHRAYSKALLKAAVKDWHRGKDLPA